MNKAAVFLISLICVAGLLSAQDQQNIAVLDLQAKNVSADDVSVLSDKLRNELINTGIFTVIERGVMDQVLKEQGFQQSGCTSNECVVEMGQLIGVTRMVAGSVGRIESTYLLSIRLIDVATGKIMKNVSEEITGSLTDVLKNGISACVARLTGTEDTPVPADMVAKEESVAPTEKPIADKAPHDKKGRFCASAGYALALGWISMDEVHSLGVHGFSAAAGVKFPKSRLVADFTWAGGERDSDIANETNQVFFGLSTFTVGAGVTWYLEVLNLGKYVTIAPALGLGFWMTSDEYTRTGTASVTAPVIEHSNEQFASAIIRISGGPDVIRFYYEGGVIFGNQYDLDPPPGTDYGSYDTISRIPPIMLVRAGVIATF